MIIFGNIKRIAKLTLTAFVFLSGNYVMASGLPEEPVKAAQAAGKSSCLSIETQTELIGIGYFFLNRIVNDKDLNFTRNKSFPDSSLFKDLTAEKTKYAPTWSQFALQYHTRRLTSNSDLELNVERKNRLFAIISIYWALADMAEQQGEAFKQGSYTIVDPKHLLASFFDKYKEVCAKIATNLVYERISTHHKGRCPATQLGIDARFEPWEGIRKLFPHDMTHLLTARFNTDDKQEAQLLFIKPEKVGMGDIGAWIVHGAHLVESKVYGPAPGSRRERESDIPADITGQFKELQESIRFPGEYKTVQSMYTKATEVLESEFKKGPELSLVGNNARYLINKIDTLYPNGHNDKRTGNEVIIDLSNKEPIKARVPLALRFND